MTNPEVATTGKAAAMEAPRSTETRQCHRATNTLVSILGILNYLVDRIMKSRINLMDEKMERWIYGFFDYCIV